MAIKLTLICPVYKVSQYIPELMQSLLNGVNNKQVEIIFVDDRCPEHSIDICEAFLKEHQKDIQFNTKIIKLAENQGQASARNKALKNASGVYIGFIDSDDAISPSYWNILEPYINNANSDIIEFDFKEFSDHLPCLNSSQVTAVNQLESSNLNPFFTGFFVWTRLYKKDIVNNLFFPEGKIYEDIFYNIHAFANSKSTFRIDACLIYYRKRDNSTTTSRDASYSNLLLNMVDSVKSTLDAFENKNILVFQLARYSLLVSLKGFTIKDRSERNIFFTKCKSINMSLKPIFYEYNSSLLASLKFRFSQFICSIGRFL